MAAERGTRPLQRLRVRRLARAHADAADAQRLAAARPGGPVDRGADRRRRPRASTSSATRAGRSTCSATTSSSPASGSTRSRTGGWPGSCATSPTRRRRPTSGARWRRSAARRPTCSAAPSTAARASRGRWRRCRHGCPSALFRGVNILNTGRGGRPMSAARARSSSSGRWRAATLAGLVAFVASSSRPTCAGPNNALTTNGEMRSLDPHVIATADVAGGTAAGTVSQRDLRAGRGRRRWSPPASRPPATPGRRRTRSPLVGRAPHRRRLGRRPADDRRSSVFAGLARALGEAFGEARGGGPPAVRLRRARRDHDLSRQLHRPAAARRPAHRAGRAQRQDHRLGRSAWAGRATPRLLRRRRRRRCTPRPSTSSAGRGAGSNCPPGATRRCCRRGAVGDLMIYTYWTARRGTPTRAATSSPAGGGQTGSARRLRSCRSR